MSRAGRHEPRVCTGPKPKCCAMYSSVVSSPTLASSVRHAKAAAQRSQHQARAEYWTHLHHWQDRYPLQSLSEFPKEEPEGQSSQSSPAEPMISNLRPQQTPLCLGMILLVKNPKHIELNNIFSPLNEDLPSLLAENTTAKLTIIFVVIQNMACGGRSPEKKHLTMMSKLPGFYQWSSACMEMF